MEVIINQLIEQMATDVSTGKLKILDVPFEIRTLDFEIYENAIKKVRYGEQAFVELKKIEHLLLHDIIETDSKELKYLHDFYFGNRKSCMKYVQAAGGRVGKYGGAQ